MESGRSGGLEADRSESLAAHARAFQRRFGAGEGLRQFFSPGRVNLMGAHLDYNGGPVMPTAIDRGTFIAVRQRSDRLVRMASTLDGVLLDLDLENLPRRKAGVWADYPHGVIIETLNSMRDVRMDDDIKGLDILFGGNLPVGAGLSSSASICVGTAVALDHVWNQKQERMDLVQIALRAEREFVGVRCGIMDPYAVGLAREGHLLWLDCKDGSSSYMPLDAEQFSIAVADTLVRRELAQGAFNQRVWQCTEAFEKLRAYQAGATCLRDIGLDAFEKHKHELDPLTARRAEHVIREVVRTFAARAALLRDDPSGFGNEMFRAHESLRDLFDVSVPQLDQLVQSASQCEGVLGSRLTGAGFGGCAVVLLRKGAEAEVSARLTLEFERRFSTSPRIEFFEGDAGPREIAGAWDEFVHA